MANRRTSRAANSVSSSDSRTQARATAEPASPEELANLGRHALRYVRPGWTIGLGTGRAASAFIRALAEDGIAVRGVPTSRASANLARRLKIALVELSGSIDLDVDGADEVDPALNLIKGYGGALVREKIVASAARRRVILVGHEKLVSRLGQRGCVPVEVLPFAAEFCARRIRALGLDPQIRRGRNGKQFVTDNGNLILDCGVKRISNPAALDRELVEIPGVVGTGIFCGFADVVLVAEPGGKIRTLRKPR